MESLRVYRVVLADDLPEYLHWLRSLVESGPQFRVIGEASNGREALTLVGELSPDLVIADVEMPELDGLELAQRVREAWPEVQVVLISSHWEREYVELARAAGALAFLSKADLSLESLTRALPGAARP